MDDVAGDVGGTSPHLETWINTVEARGRSVDALGTRLREGLELKPLYTAADRVVCEAMTAAPGEAPFARGASTDTPVRLMRYDATDVAAVNEHVLEDLAGGMSGLALAFDRRARLGQTNTDGLGAGGCAIDGLGDLARALDDVQLDLVTTWFEAGANTLPAAALFLALLEARGADAAAVRVHFGFDPLGALAHDGALPAGLDCAMREMASLARYAVEHLPNARTVTVSVEPYHAAGCDGAQELAYALATGADYVRALVDAGVSLEDAAKQIGFRMPIGRDVFLEIAKLRALRLTWGSALRAMGVSACPPADVHAVLAPRIMSRFDPWVNMLRATGGAFAAITAGADAVSVLPYDTFHGEPTSLGRRVARNTLNVLIEEGQLDAVSDPAGGSYYLDALTDRLGRAGWATFQEIEAAGGMREALVGGVIRRAVDERYAVLERSIRTRKIPITGVSRFPDLDETPPPAEDDAAVSAAIARLNDARRTREGAPEISDPSIDGLTAAARAGATVGELGRALDRGPAAAIDAFPLRRNAEVFESLRQAVATADGDAPVMTLVTIGSLAEHQARSKFAQDAFGVGGFRTAELNVPAGDEAAQRSAIAAAAGTGAPAVVCICGTDEHYAASVAPLAEALVGIGVRWIAVAGRGGEHEDTWRAAGVRAFVHLKADLHDVLVDALGAFAARGDG